VMLLVLGSARCDRYYDPPLYIKRHKLPTALSECLHGSIFAFSNRNNRLASGSISGVASIPQ
jgi:hypothetical protein